MTSNVATAVVAVPPAAATRPSVVNASEVVDVTSVAVAVEPV